MKLKRISLMTVAAIYSASVAAATTASNNADITYEKVSVEPFDMTDEQYQQVLDYQQQLMNRQGQTTGPNVHRQVSTNGDKVPFRFEQGLSGEQTYIIQLDNAPLATYQGGINGFYATAPTSKTVSTLQSQQHFTSAASNRYASFLAQKQNSVQSEISRVTGTPNLAQQSYKYAFNGFSIKLTQEQAAQVAKLSGVRAVTRSRVLELHTDVGPKHIGADQVWNGTVTSGSSFTGAGIVVGVLDTGINSNHPSFAVKGDDGVVIENPLGTGNYLGDCETEEFQSLCNDKLIGIRSYAEITDSYGDPVFRNMHPVSQWEMVRPANGEDYNGHGSHTASTVAGNILYDVAYQMAEFGTGEEINGRDTDLTFPMVSGVAPHANIISYQVCWAGGSGAPYAGCPEEVTLKAIDDAIADGVDVINYSVGGAEQLPWEAPVELAFLAAREAGISVAASAGNAGYYWMDHVSPWLTSVAASTHGRVLSSDDKKLEGFEGGDSIPTAYSYSAASITKGYTGPVVLAEHYDSSNASCDQAFPENTFDFLPDGSALSEDPIVVCARSDQPRVAKSDNVKAGGAGGFILYNSEPDYTYGDSTVQKVDDFYSLPSAHIGNYHGSKVIEWLNAGTGHRVTITDGSLYTEQLDADILADFSSRGPSKTNPNVMAPTVAAPGVDVFAAYANDRIFTLDNYGMNWAMISGTSMASPHVAGAMALIKNANPNWTPAEIQSALTTTTTPAFNNNGTETSFDDAGAGVINVANAIQATLVLDETVENYTNANPYLGGDSTSLNTPYLVNRECEQTCSWYRTFTATESGTWHVSAHEVGYVGASLMKLEVSPSQFSLTQGETQRVMVTATLPDADYQSDAPIGEGNTGGLTLSGKLVITPTAASKPVQSLPIIATLKRADIPTIIETDIGRAQGEYVTPPMLLKASASLSANVYGMSQGTTKEYALRQYKLWPTDVIDMLPSEESQIGYRMFDVPEGTKRLVVEISEEDDAFRYSSRLDLGRDVNNDGKINWHTETICMSDWRKRDYCAINNPEPGRYWYMVSNLKFGFGFWDPYDSAQRIVTNVVIIDDQVTDKLSVPSTASDGVSPVQLALNWDLANAQEADIYHGVIELGTDSANADIGMLPVRFTRTADDVTITASHQGAKIGDTVDFEIVHQANLFGQDRELNIQIDIPDGLTLDANSVRGNEFAQELISVEENSIVIAGLQPSSLNSPRTYEFTTNLDDEMCRLPFSDYPDFVPLADLGVPQLPGFENEYQQMFEIPDFLGYRNYFPHIPLYGVEAKDTDNIITIQGDGMFRFDAHALLMLPGYTFANDGLRDLVVAPMWRANSVTLNESGMDFATFTPFSRGLYAASLNQNKYLAVQWKEMFNKVAGSGPWAPAEIDRSQHFTFQALASSTIDFKPGVYEMFFSYKDLTGDKGEHSVGLKGYQGTRGFYYPVNGYNYDEYAINQPEKFDSDVIVCGNYQGPESTRLVTRFSAKVKASAATQTEQVTMTASVTNGNTVSQTLDVTVNGSITVFDLTDQTIDENTRLDDMVVEYVHSKNREVAVEVSGANVTAEIDGTNFSLIPDANWHGSSEITVSVFDVANPADKAATNFMLTVASDGIDYGCMDATATNYDANANTDDGSCQYPVTDSDVNANQSSSGALLWLLALLPLTFRRKA